MTAFKVGDKVLHPLTGDNVLLVRWVGVEHLRANIDDDDPHGYEGIARPAAEFTPYTPPRVSTAALHEQVEQAWHAWNIRTPLNYVVRTQALAEAATGLAERLEEESR